MNAVFDCDTVFLKQAISELTDTAKNLSKDVSALKLQLHESQSQSHQMSSPHSYSPMRYGTAGNSQTEQGPVQSS